MAARFYWAAISFSLKSEIFSEVGNAKLRWAFRLHHQLKDGARRGSHSKHVRLRILELAKALSNEAKPASWFGDQVLHNRG